MQNRYFKQGEIWLASLNSAKQSEPGKTRPILIIQNQDLLDALHSTIVIVPLTTNIIDDAEPLRVRINKEGKLEKDSDLLIDQIRAIDNSRITGSILLNIGNERLKLVLKAVAQVIGHCYK